MTQCNYCGKDAGDIPGRPYICRACATKPIKDVRDEIPPRCACCGLPGHEGGNCPNMDTVVVSSTDTDAGPIDMTPIYPTPTTLYPGNHVADLIRADVAEKRVKELEAEIESLKSENAADHVVLSAWAMDIVELKEQIAAWKPLVKAAMALCSEYDVARDAASERGVPYGPTFSTLLSLVLVEARRVADEEKSDEASPHETGEMTIRNHGPLCPTCGHVLCTVAWEPEHVRFFAACKRCKVCYIDLKFILWPDAGFKEGYEPEEEKHEDAGPA